MSGHFGFFWVCSQRDDLAGKLVPLKRSVYTTWGKGGGEELFSKERGGLLWEKIKGGLYGGREQKSAWCGKRGFPGRKRVYFPGVCNLEGNPL